MRSLFIIVVFISISFNIFGQYGKRITTLNAHNSWYVGANGGVNFFLAEGYPGYQLYESAGLSGRTIVGYKLSEFLGIQSSIGFTHVVWPDVRLASNRNISIDAESVTFDALVNLSKLMFPYSTKHKLDLCFVGGAGVAYRNKGMFSTSIYSPVIRGGFQAEIALNSIWHINLITDIHVLNDLYNDYSTGIPFEVYPAVSLGFTYNFVINKNKCNCKLL